jgi:hypothetical protein
MFTKNEKTNVITEGNGKASDKGETDKQTKVQAKIGKVLDYSKTGNTSSDRSTDTIRAVRRKRIVHSGMKNTPKWSDGVKYLEEKNLYRKEHEDK